MSLKYQSLATFFHIQVEAAVYRRAESGIRKRTVTIKLLLNNMWKPQGLTFVGSQNEFLNHFYWNFLAAGNGLTAAEYADFKEMQYYSFIAWSLLAPWLKSLRMLLPPAWPA